MQDLLTLNGLEVSVECIKPVVPHFAPLVNPVDGQIEPFGFKATRPSLGLAAARNKATVLKDLDVLGHSLKREIEWFGQLVDGRLAAREVCENRPPGGVRQCIEGGIQVFISERYHPFVLP